MNYDIVTIGSAVLDLHVKSDIFTVAPVRHQLMVCEIYGGKTDVEDARLSSGGAATNTAVSFARQGFVVGCVAEVGRDVAAQVIWDDLHRDGVHTRLLVEKEDKRTGISAILVAEDGSRSVMTYRGAAHDLEIADVPFEKIQDVRAIHLSSVGSTELIRKVSEFCHQRNIFLSWNPSKAEAEELFLKQKMTPNFCNMLFLNDLEWDAVKKMEHAVLQSAEVFVVTRGDKGGEVYTRGEKQVFQAKATKAVCATGAGDAFASGMVGAHLRGESLSSAIQFGIDNSASVVGYIGAKEGLLRISV